jgi:hypothetical protein
MNRPLIVLSGLLPAQDSPSHPVPWTPDLAQPAGSASASPADVDALASSILRGARSILSPRLASNTEDLRAEDDDE